MKVKDWFKKHKQAIVRLLILFAVVLTISAVIIGILFATGVFKIVGHQICFNNEIFEAIKDEWWFFLVFLIIQVLMTVLLCFVPGTSMMFITATSALFPDEESWKAFLLCFAGVILSSILMDLVGRYGGSRLVKKLIGEEEYNRAYELVQTKGITYIPVMYLLPIFPDDGICMITGTLKFKFWIHLIDIILCRGVGVATIVFGFQLVPFESFTQVYDWFVFIAVLMVYIFVLFKIAHWIDKKITGHLLEKRNKKTEAIKETPKEVEISKNVIETSSPKEKENK